MEIISIPSKEFNHGKSRNLGVTKAKGDFIIIQTDDAMPINDYLYSDMCEWFLKDPKIMVVSSRQIPKSDSDLISQFTINKHYFYLDLEKDSIRSSNNFDEMPTNLRKELSLHKKELKRFKLKDTSWLFSKRYRFLEWSFSQGEPIYVLGYAESGLKAIKKEKLNGFFQRLQI